MQTPADSVAVSTQASEGQLHAAVAKRLSALSTTEFFMQRAARGKPDALDEILNRTGGKAPRQGDERP